MRAVWTGVKSAICCVSERKRIPKFTKGYRLTDLFEMSSNKKSALLQFFAY